jgi:hypothetical protein
VEDDMTDKGKEKPDLRRLLTPASRQQARFDDPDFRAEQEAWEVEEAGRLFRAEREREEAAALDELLNPALRHRARQAASLVYHEELEAGMVERAVGRALDEEGQPPSAQQPGDFLAEVAREIQPANPGLKAHELKCLLPWTWQTEQLATAINA